MQSPAHVPMILRLLGAGALAVTLMIVGPSSAGAQGYGGDISPLYVEQKPPEKTRRDHVGQGGLRVGFGIPYVLAIRYGSGPACDRPAGDPNTFCRRLGVPLLDLEGSYGIRLGLEASALVRVGLATDDASGRRPFSLGIGIRRYEPAGALVKLMVGGRVMLDLTPSDRAQWKDIDFGARGEIGVQVDPLEHLGIYAQLGASFFFLRGFWLMPDVTAGLQGRFP